MLDFCIFCTKNAEIYIFALGEARVYKTGTNG